jgi:mono/diheme cytochrome c family protein
MNFYRKIKRYGFVFGAIAGASANGVAQNVDFAGEIWPIFEGRCIECHGPEKQKEGLRFDDLEWLSDEELLGGGDSSESLIFEMVTLPDDEDGYMPKKRERLSG